MRVLLLLSLACSVAWPCKMTPMGGSGRNLTAVYEHLLKYPKLAAYSIEKIEHDNDLYIVTMGTLNQVKCELFLKIKVTSSCKTLVNTFGDASCAQ